LLADPASAGKIGGEVLALLAQGQTVTAEQVRGARAYQARWQSEWTALLSSVDAVVLPTLPIFPPPLAEANQHHLSALTAPVNLAGLPALALPVPAAHELPASMQVVGAHGGEEALLATGALLAEAAGYRP
jgi:amidase